MRPTFLIVGAAKSGTTSLHEYLNQHPQVFIPKKKECLFFSGLKHFNGPDHDQELNQLITRDIVEYEALFKPAGTAQALGDVSHDYLYYFDDSITNIKRYLGDEVRIAMILRDPRDRAFSHYTHHVKGGISPDADFETALAREDERIAAGWSWNWHYTRVGMYSLQVEAYLNAFPNVQVYLYDDLVKDCNTLVANLFEFIGVAPGHDVDLSVHNRGYDIRNRQLNRFLKRESQIKDKVRSALIALGITPDALTRIKRRLLAVNTLEKSRMNQATRDLLTQRFAADVTRLSALIDRDLSGWVN